MLCVNALGLIHALFDSVFLLFTGRLSKNKVNNHYDTACSLG